MTVHCGCKQKLGFTLVPRSLIICFALLFGDVFIVVVEKCDAAPVALQLSMPVTTSAPLYRLMSPGTVVNVSQKTSSASLTGVAPSPLVNMFGGATSSVAGSGGLGRPAMATTTTNATVLHTIRPVATHPIAVCTSMLCFLFAVRWLLNSEWLIQFVLFNL